MKTNRLFVVLVGALTGGALMLGSGCSGGTTGGSGGGSGGSSGGGSGGSGGGSGGGSASTSSGIISVEQTASVVAGTTFYSSVVSATFYATTPSGGANCTTTTMSGCSVTDCNLSDAGSTAPTTVSAGALTLTGPTATTADGGTITLDFAAGAYAPASINQQLFASGDTLTVSAAGDTVPAFSGKTVVAPGDLTLTAPSCATFQCGALSRTADLAVTWSGGGAATATVVSLKTGVHEVIATCALASSPATIPSAVMAKLGDSTDGYSGTFSVTPQASSTFTAGAYSIAFVASGSGGFGSFSTSN